VWAIIASQDIVERSTNEQTSFGGDPPKLVFTLLSHSSWIQHPEERGNDIHLPIMSRCSKAFQWKIEIYVFGAEGDALPYSERFSQHPYPSIKFFSYKDLCIILSTLTNPKLLVVRVGS